MIGLTPWGSSTVTTDARPVAAIIELEKSINRGSSVSLEPDRPWRRYLQGLAQEGTFSAAHIQKVERIWDELRRRAAVPLPIPRTQPTGRGAIQIAWYSNRYTVEIDVVPDGRFEWFCRDRVSGEISGTDDEPTEEITAELLTILRAAVQ
jgi:hypothetical protein